MIRDGKAGTQAGAGIGWPKLDQGRWTARLGGSAQQDRRRAWLRGAQAAQWQRIVVPAAQAPAPRWPPAPHAPGRSRTGRSCARVASARAAPVAPRPRRGRSARCRVDRRQQPAVPAKSSPAEESGSRPQASRRRTRAWVVALAIPRSVSAEGLDAQGAVRSVGYRSLASCGEAGKPSIQVPAILVTTPKL